MQETQETWVRLIPWFGKIPWRRAWQPTPVFLPGEAHRQRSLVGYSLKGRKRVEQNWIDLARTCTICRPVASHSGSFSQVQDLKPHPNPCWTKIYIFTRFSADSMHTEIRGALVYLEITPYLTWGNQDPRKLNDLGRVTNLVKSDLILLKEICFSPDPCSLRLCQPYSCRCRSDYWDLPRFWTCAHHFTLSVSFDPLPHPESSVAVLPPFFFLIGNQKPKEV